MGIYDYTVKDAKGNDVSLKDYEGKVLLIVNTATGCGFTPQPCNQFGNQAPGTEEEIVTFCTGRFGVTFKQFAKIEVNGANEAPLYAYLKSQKKGMVGSNIKWNFTKFLVDRKGNVVSRFSPTTTPEQIDEKIKELL